MRGRLHPLPIALCSGLVAVLAAGFPLLVSSAQQQVQYTVSTHADLPRIICMFGGCKSESETITVSNSRQRTDKGGTSEIIECDLKRFVHLDNNAKTYYVLTFDQERAAMEAAMNRARGMQQQQQQSSGATPAPIHGSGGFTLSVNTVNDPQTQMMFGMTAHHVITTITGTSTGTGECPNGTMSLTSDEWYVPKAVSFSCPLPRPPLAALPPMPQGGGGGRTNPCFGRFSIEATGKAHSGNTFALKTTTTMDMGMKITTHEDVTQYQVMPYDPSAFNVPAGYTQVSPPPMGR